MAWEAAEKVQKNASGQYRAMIGGEWVPVAKAQKNANGVYRVERVSEPAQDAVQAATAPQQPDSADILAGSPAARFALGAASPFLGAAQLGAEAFGFKGVTDHLKRLEEMKKRGTTPAAELERLKQGRESLSKLKGYEATIAQIDKQIAALGDNPSAATEDAGFDVAGLAGTIMSPATLGAMKIPAAASVLGRSGQGAAIGAAFGAASPVTGGDDFWSNKAAQVGTGAVIGGVIPPAIDAGRKVVGITRNILDPVLPGGAERGAGRILANTAGPKRAAIEAELAKNQVLVPGSNPTAAEAAARAGSPEFSALQRIAADHRPSAYSDIAKAQEAARLASIRSFGKTPEALEAASKTRSANAETAYGAIRNIKVDPRSDTEIMEAAIASRAASKGEALRDWGRFATTASQNEARGANFTPVAGMPRVSGRASNFPDRVSEARDAASEAIVIAKQRYGEEQFLKNTLALLKDTVGMESKNLQVFLGRPSIGEAVKDAMKSAQETGTYFPTKAGEKFSVGNLQRIKESLDAGISASKRAADAGRRPELSPAELEGTKKAFVNWLSGKVPAWRDARHQYLQDSMPMNRMQVGQELEKALVKPLGEGERSGVFAGAVREAPRTIKNATGQSRFETLDEVLTPKDLASVKDVLADLARKAEFERLAPSGRAKAAEMAQPFGLPATGPLHQSYMIFKTVLGRVSKGINEKTLDTMADALQVPAETLRLLQKVPTAQQAAVIDQIIGAKLGRGAIAAGASLAAEGIDNAN